MRITKLTFNRKCSQSVWSGRSILYELTSNVYRKIDIKTELQSVLWDVSQVHKIKPIVRFWGGNRQRKFMIKKLDNDSIDRLVLASKHMVQINIFVLSHKKAIKVIWRIRYLTTVQYLPKRWEPLVPETQRVPHCLMIAST